MQPNNPKRWPGRWLQALMSVLLGVLLLAGTGARAATETITHLHTDISGSPLAATDASGAVLWKESYRAYGSRWLNEPGSETQTQWFHGKEQDTATGLQYFGARYYDPAVGRFLGIDPVDFQDGNLHSFNRYAYGNNNPVKFKDPDGGYAEVAVEALSLAIGLDSLRKNFFAGNYGAAAVDGVGVVADAVLTAIPVAPGVAGLGIKAVRESSDAVLKGVTNWKSVTQFGHTFSQHGAGVKNTERLLDRARGTGDMQGQWLNNEKAAEILSGIKADGPAVIRIPEGLGQVIKPDGTIVKTEWATVVPKGDGLRTAYPTIGP